MKISLVILTVLLAIVVACNKDKFETKPTIKIKSINTDYIPLNGTFVITLECTDKEGDVQDSVIIIKQRLNKKISATLHDTIRYKIPAFPFNTRTEITANLNYQLMLAAINPPNIPGSNPVQKEPDTLILKLAVRDTAGHTSDTISTKQIIVYRQ